MTSASQRRSFEELLDTEDPAWPLVQTWFAEAQPPIEILSTKREQAERTLLHLQVTTRSPLGAVAFETGGLLFDRGWLRFLGSGNERLRGSLLSWNGVGEGAPTSIIEGALIVAHDAIGGFFALNGGAFPNELGNVFYWAPDSLRWEAMHQSYSDLLYWAARGGAKGFYGKLRWPGWNGSMRGCGGDQGFSIYPPLWAEGPPILERDRRVVPLLELWALQQDLAQRMVVAAEGREEG